MRAVWKSAYGALGCIAVCCGANGALAHDRWTGGYVGITGGLVGADIDGSHVAIPADAHSGSTSSSAAGLHAGYNWRFSQLPWFVLGAEASYMVNGLTGDRWSRADTGTADCLTVSATPNQRCQNRVESFLTLGARLGFNPTDRAHLFLNVGLAGGAVQTRTVDTATATATSTATDWASGVYFGFGGEWSMTPSWVIGLEYLHIGLGEAILDTGNAASDRRADANVDVFRARLSYRFDGYRYGNGHWWMK